MSLGETMTFSHALLLGRAKLLPNSVESDHGHRDLCLVQGRVEFYRPIHDIPHHPRRPQEAAQLRQHRRLERGGRAAGGAACPLFSCNGQRSGCWISNSKTETKRRSGSENGPKGP